MEKKNTKTEGQAHMQINHAQQIEKLLRVEGCSSQTTYVHISILTGGVSDFKAIFIGKKSAKPYLTPSLVVHKFFYFVLKIFQYLLIKWVYVYSQFGS